jgi:hypothetical protein
MSATQDDRLERLLNQLADGMLAEVDEQELGEILRADTSARRQYCQFSSPPTAKLRNWESSMGECI